MARLEIITTDGHDVLTEIVTCPECDCPADLRGFDWRAGIAAFTCARCAVTFTRALPPTSIEEDR